MGIDIAANVLARTVLDRFVSGLQVTSPCCRAASLRSLDFAHVPVVHDSHMTIVPGDRDRIPTRLSDNTPVSSITLPANASTLLEVLRFGGGHVAPPFAWVVHILGQTVCRCLSYFPVKYSSTSTTPDTTPPVITIVSDNPAHIHVGDSYADLGASVTDNVDQNLGLKYFLNGALVSNIVIDTSTAATDTVDYVAADTAGNTATSTRTVIVEAI